MQHSEAQKLLTHLVDGELAPSRKSAVEAHTAECEGCREWLAAARFLSDSLGAPAADPHPASELLASYALMPESLSEPGQKRCADHLVRCSDCRKDVDLARAAAAAGDSTVAPPSRAAVLPRFAASTASSSVSAFRALLAAGVLVAFGASVLVEVSSQSQQGRVLSGAVIDGEHTMRAERSILVDETVVNSGARATFESGEQVAFGNGFSVGSGASMAVSTPEKNNDDSSS